MLEFQMDSRESCRTVEMTPDEFQQSLPFYLQECGFWRMGDRYYTKRDALNSYLLLVTTEGAGRMSWNDGSCVLEPGSAVLIDCNGYQEYATLPGSIWGFYYIHFQALSMEGFRNIFLRRLTPIRLRRPEKFTEEIERLYHTSAQTNAVGYISLSNHLSNLLTELVHSLASGGTKENQLNRADMAGLAEYIRQHAAQPLHLDDFIRYTNLSRHYLIHVFERQFGMPPYRYLHLCRVNQAQQLLKATELTVEEIAEQVGYSSAAVFIRHFKSFFGMTPGGYREQVIR